MAEEEVGAVVCARLVLAGDDAPHVACKAGFLLVTMYLSLCTQRPCSPTASAREHLKSLQLHPAESEAFHDRGGAERSVFH